MTERLPMLQKMKAAEEMGLRCPEDFGLVSFDDYPWLSVFRPRLTTVELPKHELGSQAAELLIRRIEGDKRASVRARQAF
jgi:DNA-binding LacI/PurR family transcriptional regulator